MLAILLCIDVVMLLLYLIVITSMAMIVFTSLFIPVVALIRVKSAFWRGVTPGFL